MSELSVQQMREALKRIAKGDVRPEDLLGSGNIVAEIWTEDESDSQYMRMTFPDNNKRMTKADYERRAALLKQTRVTMNIF